jgi:hypothetical protein
LDKEKVNEDTFSPQEELRSKSPEMPTRDDSERSRKENKEVRFLENIKGISRFGRERRGSMSRKFTI